MDTFTSYTDARNYVTELGNKASGAVDRIIIENQTKQLELEYITNGHTTGSVSYAHLTLPTKRIV